MNIANNEKDRFVKQALKTASVEDPGNSFVPSVMDRINELNAENSKLPVADPIISRRGWFLAAFFVISIFSFSFYFNSNTFSFSIIYDYFEKISFPHLSIPVSGIFITGLLAFVFYFIIQILFITRRINM